MFMLCKPGLAYMGLAASPEPSSKPDIQSDGFQLAVEDIALKLPFAPCRDGLCHLHKAQPKEPACKMGQHHCGLMANFSDGRNRQQVAPGLQVPARWQSLTRSCNLSRLLVGWFPAGPM